MMENLKDDQVVDRLLGNSSLSTTQLSAYITYLKRKKGEKLKIDEFKIKNFRTRGSLMGSYLQAKRNIKRSLYTILLLFYLGIWKKKELDALSSLIKGMIVIKEKGKDYRERVMTFIEEIIEVMIMM